MPAGTGMRSRRPCSQFSAVAAPDAVSKIISASRSSGTLNLSNRELEQVPAEVYNISSDGENIKWWEVNELTKLDLSHNKLAVLPEQLWSLTSLNTIYISFNQLQQLPPAVEALSCLKLLDIADNPHLCTVPAAIAQLPCLASINCSNCSLQALPDALGLQQPQLSIVQAAGNQLKALPAGLRAAKALVALKVSNNHLQQLPGEMMEEWGSLTELDISNNLLQELPDALGKLTKLQQLDVRHNQLTSLPVALGNNRNLLELRAGFNKVQELPAEFGMLVTLRTLDLRNNLIQELPAALCHLQLVLLDLTNNSLRRLPPELGLMTSLRSMPLDGNPLKLMRRELWSGPISALLQHLRDQIPTPDSSNASTQVGGEQQISAGSMKSAQAATQPGLGPASRASGSTHMSGGGGGVGELVLQGRGLTCIPAQVWQGGSLSKLDLSDNPLGHILFTADMLCCLQQLKVLCLNSCSLTQWPLSNMPPAGLSALHTLQACGNPFERGVLPAGGLAACPNLRSLDLSGVRGLQVPEAFFCSTPLEEFTAAQARLTEFPAAVLACSSSLRVLALASNNISSVPPDVTMLTRLSELDFSNNDLNGLPPQMGLMAGQLRVLRVEGNSLRTIRRPILDKGTAALLDWLKDRIPV